MAASSSPDGGVRHSSSEVSGKDWLVREWGRSPGWVDCRVGAVAVAAWRTEVDATGRMRGAATVV